MSPRDPEPKGEEGVERTPGFRRVRSLREALAEVESARRAYAEAKRSADAQAVEFLARRLDAAYGHLDEAWAAAVPAPDGVEPILDLASSEDCLAAAAIAVLAVRNLLWAHRDAAARGVVLLGPPAVADLQSVAFDLTSLLLRHGKVV
jgi:hypothetical protein